MEMKDVTLYRANVSNRIFTGTEILGSAHLLGVVQKDTSDNHFLAIFQKSTGELYARKAIIDIVPSMTRTGTTIQQDIYIGTSNAEFSETDKEAIRKSIESRGDLEFFGEGEVNVGEALHGQDPNVWVVGDNELQHLESLKRRYENCPLMYSIEMIPYNKETTLYSETGSNRIDDDVER